MGNDKKQEKESLSIKDLEFYKRIYKKNKYNLFLELISKNKVTLFEDQLVKNKNHLDNFSNIGISYMNFRDYNNEIKDIYDGWENAYEDYEEEIENMVSVICDGLSRLEEICKEKKVRIYSMPILVYNINTFNFKCDLDALINSLMIDFFSNIVKEETDFIRECDDYTKVSLVYNINKSNVEVVNRVFINFSKNNDKKFKKNSGVYITQIFWVDDKEDYEKLADVFLNLNISSSQLNLVISKNLRECEKNIDKGLIRLPDSYLIYPHK